MTPAAGPGTGHGRGVGREDVTCPGQNYLSFGRLYYLPVVELQLVQLVELHADVLDGELQHVPVARQVLGRGSRHGAGVLPTREHSLYLLFPTRAFQGLGLGRSPANSNSDANIQGGPQRSSKFTYVFADALYIHKQEKATYCVIPTL